MRMLNGLKRNLNRQSLIKRLIDEEKHIIERNMKGMIDIEDKIKEALTNTRVHPETGESLPAGGASFDINIPQLTRNLYLLHIQYIDF